MAETKNVTKASTKKPTTAKTSKEEAKSVVNLCMEDTFDLEDLEGRRLYINFGIDEMVIESIVYQIMRFNRQDKGLPVEKRKPIIIYINSIGGCVSDGWGLIDAIITSKTPVYTVNQALCASMGFLVFLAGNKRFAMPHAEFLMHDGGTGVANSTAKARDYMDFETNQLEVMTKEYVCKYTKITPALYDEKYRVEWWFLPKEGKEIGVVDYIISEDCDIDDII